MQKIKIILITLIAVVGAFLIYHHFDNIKKNEVVVDRFSSEYNLVSENNIFKYSTIDEVLDILQEKTGIVFFCTNESDWCNHYAANLNDALMSAGVSEVYYYDIMKDRQLNTLKYLTLKAYQ